MAAVATHHLWTRPLACFRTARCTPTATCTRSRFVLASLPSQSAPPHFNQSQTIDDVSNLLIPSTTTTATILSTERRILELRRVLPFAQRDHMHCLPHARSPISAPRPPSVHLQGSLSNVGLVSALDKGCSGVISTRAPIACRVAGSHVPIDLGQRDLSLASTTCKSCQSFFCF